MQTRPFFKRVLGFFKGDPRPLTKIPPASRAHEYPLSEPKQATVRHIKRYRRRYRNPPIRQRSSNDPRFNHALRRKL